MALAHLARAVVQLREAHPAYAAHYLTTMAIAHAARGAHAEALTCIDEARRGVGDDDDDDDVGVLDYLLTVEASICSEVGDYQRALVLQRQQIDAVDSNDHLRLAESLYQLGITQGRLGQARAGIESLTRAAELYAKLDDHESVSSTLQNRGDIQRLVGETELAVRDCERALEVHEEETRTRAWAWQTLGRALVACGAKVAGRADAAFRAALRFERAKEDLQLRFECRRGLADAALLQGRVEPARAEAKRSMDLLDLLDVGLADSEAAYARAHNSAVVDTALRCALARPTVGHLFDTLESCRARVLASALGGGAGAAATGFTAAQSAREREAREWVVYAQERYLALREEGELKVSRAAGEAWLKAREAYRATLVSIERENRMARSLSRVTHASLKEVQGSLRPGDVLVSYVLIGDRAGAVVATHDAAAWREFEKPKKILEDCAALTTIWEDGGDPEEIAARLAGRILSPLALPTDTKRLLISPDGPLTFLPFPYLLASREDLPKDVEVALVPSATVYRQLRREAGREGKRVLALGDPVYRDHEKGHALRLYGRQEFRRLRESGAEVKAVTGDKDVALVREEASETAFRRALCRADAGRWRMILLSCHGVVNPERPLMSALVLTPTAEDDGFLTAAEIMHLDMPTDLVALSACESGLGKSLKGEGTLGLVRAFMCAGAPRVLASLWNVDDEATRVLMTQFHQELRKEGASTAEALRRAQAFVRGKAGSRWRHPKYWAAWVLWGLPD